MPTRILAIPFVLLLALMLYLSLAVDERFSVVIIFCTVTLAMLFVFSPQIDWWWYSRRPPELEDTFRQFLRQRHPFYMDLSPEEKLKFRQRIALFRLAKDFMPQGMEEVPDDIRFFIALNGVHLTFGWDDYLLPEYEKIIIYLHPFPSPQYPDRFHASEIFKEDGVMMFSAQHLVKGVMEPRRYFPVGLYEMAKVAIQGYPQKPWPRMPEDSWERLQRISGVGRDALVQYMNLDDLAPLPVSIVYFLTSPELLRREWPELFGKLNGVLMTYATSGTEPE